MSLLLPQETIDTLRTFNDLSVDLYGIDCILYVPNNENTIDPNAIYDVNSTVLTYDRFNSKVFIEWSPNIKELKKLGIFTEGELPIIAYFRNYPRVVIGSYISIALQYIPRQFDFNTGEFSIVDVVVKGLYNAEVTKAYKIAPRRKK